MVLKLNTSEFIGQKKFVGPSFKESCLPTVKKFLKYTDRLPLVGPEREQAVMLMSQKIEACKKELIYKVEADWKTSFSFHEEPERWIQYRRAYKRLCGFLGLLERYS